MSAEVAVAVVSWNTGELLADCLRSLSAAADAGLAEVWVLDNASSDGSAELVRDLFPWVSLIASDENIGFGPAVNRVAAQSQSDWIAAANADVALDPGALARLLSAAEEHPDAAVIAPRLVLPDGSTQHSVHRFPTVTLSAVFGLGLYAVIPGLGDRWCIEGRWNPERARAVKWAHGAFLLIRRSAFDVVGGFDPAQWMYAEDLDLAWRLDHAGWQTRYVPEAEVRHAQSAATAQAFGSRRLELFMAASYEWMIRRRGRAVAVAFALVNLAAAGGRWLVLAPVARLVPARAAARDRARAYAAAHLRGLRRAVAGSADAAARGPLR